MCTLSEACQGGQYSEAAQLVASNTPSGLSRQHQHSGQSSRQQRGGNRHARRAAGGLGGGWGRRGGSGLPARQAGHRDASHNVSRSRLDAAAGAGRGGGACVRCCACERGCRTSAAAGSKQRSSRHNESGAATWHMALGDALHTHLAKASSAAGMRGSGSGYSSPPFATRAWPSGVSRCPAAAGGKARWRKDASSGGSPLPAIQQRAQQHANAPAAGASPAKPSSCY